MGVLSKLKNMPPAIEDLDFEELEGYIHDLR
jgi:hypothetical protein